jgi:antitoxin MazE
MAPVYLQCINNMKTTLRKWGNSLAIRIPKAFAEEIKVREGHPVDVCVAKGRLVVAPMTAQDYCLTDLVAAITPKNLHREVTTGVAQGREIW